MTGFKLISYEFDNLENTIERALIKKELAVFYSEPEESGKDAFQKIQYYFQSLNPRHFYRGWNNKVYPQYEIEQITIL
jgi:hypothetical protein